MEVVCEQAELLDCTGETASVEVWIDEEGLVRRIWLEEGSGGAGTIEFYDFGVAVDINPPPADQVADVADWSATKPCGLDVGSPLTDAHVLPALRGQGFDVGREESCAGDVRAALVGSTSQRVGNQGIVSCVVHAAARKGAPTSTVERASGGATLFELQNVQCLIAAVDAPDETAAPRLRRTFAELERAVQP